MFTAEFHSTPTPDTQPLLPSGIIVSGVDNWVVKLAEAAGQTHLEIVLDRCVRHDLVDEPLHDPEFVGEAFAGNHHGDVTDARFAVSL